MMNRLKPLTPCLIALCMLLTSACSTTPPQRVLIAWHTLQGKHERMLLKLIDRYNATNRDGVVVVPEQRSRTAQHTAMQGNALPHLALVQPAQAALYDQGGILAQLDTYIQADEDAQRWNDTDRADLFPFVLSAGRDTRGRLVGLPMGGDVRVLLRNRDWASEAGLSDMPTDWSAFDKSCNTATNLASGNICFGLANENTFFEEWSSVHGSSPYSMNSNALQIASQSTADAMAQLTGYLQTGVAYRAQSTQRAFEDFASGRVGYATTWSSKLNDGMTLIRERANFNIDVGTWPSNAGQPAALLVAPLWVVPKSDPDRERSAWRFIRWLLEDTQTAQWAIDTDEVPARASAVNMFNFNPALPADTARAAVLLRVAPNAKPQPMLSGWPCVQTELEASMRQIFDGQSITETLTLAQAQSQPLMNTDCSAQ